MWRYKTAPTLKDFIMLFANQNNNNNNDSRKEFICSFHARMQPMKAHTEEEVRTAVG